MLLLKLRSLIEVRNLVPACECVNWNVEQVLIFENFEKKYLPLIMRAYKNLWIFKKYAKCKELEKLLSFKCFVRLPDDDDDELKHVAI
jgi:hypothetical protein